MVLYLKQSLHGLKQPTPRTFHNTLKDNVRYARVWIAFQPTPESPHIVVEELSSKARSYHFYGDHMGKPLTFDNVGLSECIVIRSQRFKQDSLGEVWLKNYTSSKTNERAYTGLDGICLAGP